MLKFVTAFSLLALVSVQAEAQATWNILTKKYDNMPIHYTSFFVDGSTIRFFGGGGGVSAGNGLHEFKGSLSQAYSKRTIVSTGPDRYDLNYFRGVSSARAPIPNSTKHEHWLVAEVSRCYSGCSSIGKLHRMAIYRSVDSGTSWTYQGLLKVNGSEVGQWAANDALIFDPTKSATAVDLTNPANNRFVLWGGKKASVTTANVLVSADGVNYSSVAVTYPIATDSPVFVSIAKTPFGFHMMAKSGWATSLSTVRNLPVRHLFSKDLKSWTVLESDSAMRNRNYYKGVHLRYEPASKMLWAFASCEDSDNCGYLGKLAPKDYIGGSTSTSSGTSVQTETTSSITTTTVQPPQTKATPTRLPASISYKVPIRKSSSGGSRSSGRSNHVLH